MRTNRSGSLTQTTNGQYNRSDLQAAFNWLIQQPEALRKQATDPDRLMSLYYRSQNLTATPAATSESLEAAPKAAETVQLKSESQSLFRNGAIIEEPTQATAPNALPNAIPNSLPTSGMTSVTMPLPESLKVNSELQNGPQRPPELPAFEQTLAEEHIEPLPQTLQSFPANLPAPNSLAAKISPNSLSVIQEVREKLNLSSDAEAANVLISLGAKAIRKLLD